MPILIAVTDSATIDLDEASMSAWARFAVNIAYLLIGGVLGAGSSRYLKFRHVQQFGDGLNPQERAALAARLAQQGSLEDAVMLGTGSLSSAEAQADLLSSLGPEDRAAVAARLAAPNRSAPGSLAGWNTEPPASLINSSREASAELQAMAHERREAAMAARAAESERQRELAAAWDRARQSFAAWIRLPAEVLLAGIDAAKGPEEALKQVEAVLNQRAGSELAQPLNDGLAAELHEELQVARMVLSHTRAAFAPGAGVRARSLQIANAAQYVLHEMPDFAGGWRGLS